MRLEPTRHLPAARPRRGTPDETRARLIAVAADVFNRTGYNGTDSNRLARAAGYAPGTFYKHFEDKRALFLAVYAEWVSREWRDIETILADAATRDARATLIVDTLLAHHARWSVFRASLRALVAADPKIRNYYRAERKAQLALMSELAARFGGTAHAREDDAVHLFTIERCADALADGEARALGLDADAVRAMLVALVKKRM